MPYRIHMASITNISAGFIPATCSQCLGHNNEETVQKKGSSSGSKSNWPHKNGCCSQLRGIDISRCALNTDQIWPRCNSAMTGLIGTKARILLEVWRWSSEKGRGFVCILSPPQNICKIYNFHIHRYINIYMKRYK